MSLKNKLNSYWLASNAELGYLGTYLPLDMFTKLIRAGGLYTLALLPVFDWIKAYDNWKTTKNESLGKKIYERAKHILSAIISTVAIPLVFVGMITLGFGLIIGRGYYLAAESLCKAVYHGYKAITDKSSTRQDSIAQFKEHSLDALLGAAVATGFLIMTFALASNPIGWGLAAGAVAGMMIKSAYNHIKARRETRAEGGGEDYPSVPKLSRESPSDKTEASLGNAVGRGPVTTQWDRALAGNGGSVSAPIPIPGARKSPSPSF